MKDEEFRNIFSEDIPAPTEARKQEALAAAVGAFKDTQKSLNTHQGNQQSLRLTPEHSFFGRIIMALQFNRLTIASVSSACLLFVGVFVFKDAFISSQSPQLELKPGYQIEPSVTKQKAEAGDESLADSGTAEEDEAIFSDLSAPAPMAEDQSHSLDLLESVAPRIREEKAEAVKESFADRASPVSGAGKRQEANAAVVTASAKAPESAPVAARTLARTNAVANGVTNGNTKTNSNAPPVPLAKKMVSMSHPELMAPQLEQENRDRFKSFDENSVTLVSDKPVSTFSIDVDTASYSYVRRQLNFGVLPQANAVRIEELINYFDYQYPLPKSKSQPFKPTVVVHDSPWNAANKLVHIGIKGYEISNEQRPDSNLVFLLDVSGSMNSVDKLPLVKQSMALLLDTLKPNDKVSIVVYAGAAGTVLEPTEVKEKSKILQALNRLQAGGSTAGAAGISLAYQLAEQNFKDGAVNRVILATDGDFNVGITQDERLEDFVARKKDKGIYLSVLGFGRGNYQDAMMQTLAQNGNGVAAYIDTLGEAQKVLVEEASSTLFPIANDVKIQVEFNPNTVSEYRLIGYETRALKREDFNNDKVDAGDIGAGHTVTAIYEITPKGATGSVDALRYQPERNVDMPASNEYGFLKIRYKRPGEKQSQIISEPIQRVKVDWPENILREVRFATAVAGFAQLVKNSNFTGSFTYDDVIALAQKNKGDDEFGYRTEFVQLARKAKIAKGM